MIERNGDFARISYKNEIVTYENMRVRWVWDGSRYSTKEEAQFILDHTPGMEGATVIEVIEEIRHRVNAR